MRPESTPGFEERRRHRRYKLRLSMWFCASWRQRVAQWLKAEVVDLSVAGVQFRSRRRCPPGEDVKVAIEWPAGREGQSPVFFVASGVVLRSGHGRVGVQFRSAHLVVEETHILPSTPRRLERDVLLAGGGSPLS